MKLGTIEVGLEHPPFVIAEVGSNHDGSLETAKKYVQKSAEAGAHAVKFQLFKPETLVNGELKNDQGQWEKHPAWDLLKSLEVPYEWIPELQACARENNILFTCTPFDEGSIKFLDECDIDFYKVASGELTHRLFLEDIAKTKRPIVLSSGMSTEQEVRESLSWLKEASSGPIALLHCVSHYPPHDHETHLRALQVMDKKFDVDVLGFSDHGPGTVIPAASVLFGARVFEKHVTVNRTLEGPDHGFALEFDELKQLVIDLNRVWEAVGEELKEPTEDEMPMRIHARRGLWAKRDLKAGETLSREDVNVVRPCLDGSAADLKNLIGKKIPTDVKANRPLPPMKDWE